MGKIIKLTEGDLHRIVKKVLTEDNPKPEPGPSKGHQTSAIGGTNTSSAGAYVTPGGIRWNTEDQPRLRQGYDDPYYPYDGDNPNPYDEDNPRKPKTYPKSGSYVDKLRSPMCCKKCKNGRFKHQCDDTQVAGSKHDSTNCVYVTISDCQLNKRSKPGNIKGSKRNKSKK